MYVFSELNEQSVALAKSLKKNGRKRSIVFTDVFEVEDDVDGFAEQLKSKANLSWNVCTQADEMVCETYKDRVFFVMAPLSFDDNGNSDSK